MQASDQTSKYASFRKFVSPEAVRLLAIGCVTGLGMFVVELAFAYALQAFLAAIGVMPPASLSLPGWVPQLHFAGVIALLAGLGLGRGFIQWTQIFLAGKAFQLQRLLHRKRLVHWAFHSESANSARTMTYFDEHTNAAGNILQNLQALSTLLPTALLLWSGLLYLAWLPTLVATTILGLLGLALRGFDKSIGVAGHDMGVQAAAINRLVLSNIKNLLLLQIYGTAASEERKVDQRLGYYYENNLRYLALSGLKFSIPLILGVFVICTFALAAQGTNQFESPSLLLTYFYLFVRWVQTFSEGVKHISNLAFYRPAFEELRAWWAEHSNDRSVSFTPNGQRFQHPPGWRLGGVSYRYPSTNSDVIHDLDLEICPGSTLVITGSSGSGKSTLLSLLLGLQAPQCGRIEILDNASSHPLETMRGSLLASVGYVGPEPFLVAGTLEANLTYGLAENPGREKIIEALTRAECGFVQSLPKGLDHKLEEQGQGLSAGQKQRISLARALLRNPSVLILDEATANLDHETELRLVETLRALKGRITIVAVTHRQALTSIADTCLKLDR